MEIRLAGAEDAEELLAIYAPYVKNTAITFEYDVPDVSEFRSRIAETLKRYPYLVAEEEGKIPAENGCGCPNLDNTCSSASLSQAPGQGGAGYRQWRCVALLSDDHSSLPGV